MRVAVIGAGGREHALTWNLSQTLPLDDIFTIPGNGGTPNNVALDPMDFAGLQRFCAEQDIGLIVVGPEAPLAAGIADYFAGAGVRVFGPARAAARLESSKIWAKEFMKRNEVATAPFLRCDSLREAARETESRDGDIVLKYDGLAAGKGVFVSRSMAEAAQALKEFELAFGSDAPCLVEQRLEGFEVSVLGVTDGSAIRLFPAAQDHKPLLDGDRGPNTGGMGAYSPVPFVSPRQREQIMSDVIRPTIEGLAREKIPYHGVIYFGLMITAEGPQLLEYNVRFGDPEAEVILPAMNSDLLSLMLACTDGSLAKVDLAFAEEYFVDVVLASQGYPGRYPTGHAITGLEREHKDVLVFHAGTKQQEGRVVTAGGRVLNVVARGRDLPTAIDRAYAACSQIRFEGVYYRRDIGLRMRDVL